MIDVPGVFGCIPLLITTSFFYADYFYLYILQININMGPSYPIQLCINNNVEDFRTIAHLLQPVRFIIRRVFLVPDGIRNLLFE